MERSGRRRRWVKCMVGRGGEVGVESGVCSGKRSFWELRW